MRTLSRLASAVLPSLLCSLALAASPGLAQTPALQPTTPALEVISVKPNHATGNDGAFGARPDGIYAQNVPLRFMINLAFGREFGSSQIVGLPAWVDVDHFDMVAKVSEQDIPKLKGLNGGPLTTMRSEMLKAVLFERFQLKTHIELRDAPLYALVVAKGGLKMKPVDHSNTHEMPLPNGALAPGASLAIHGLIAGHEVPFSRLVQALLSDGQLDRVVLDRTGLAGDYDYLLNWEPDQPGAAAREASVADNNLPSIFTAVQEQLGLKLEPAKGQIKVLVIDRVARPTEN